MVYFAKYATAWTLHGYQLVDRATGQYKVTPTLAAGDFKLEKDGGAAANLATLPTVVPAAGRKVLLGSATGTDPVVLKSELNSVLSTVRTWLNGHIHPTPSGASSAASTPIGSSTRRKRARSPSSRASVVTVCSMRRPPAAQVRVLGR